MKIYDAEILKEVSSPHHRQIKFVLNGAGAIFFPVTCEHRTMKVDGISYEDDYRGNALAAMVTATSVEIRWHRDFSPERVMAIWNRIKIQPEAKGLAKAGVTYQGYFLE